MSVRWSTSVVNRAECALTSSHSLGTARDPDMLFLPRKIDVIFKEVLLTKPPQIKKNNIGKDTFPLKLGSISDTVPAYQVQTQTFDSCCGCGILGWYPGFNTRLDFFHFATS